MWGKTYSLKGIYNNFIYLLMEEASGFKKKIITKASGLFFNNTSNADNYNKGAWLT